MTTQETEQAPQAPSRPRKLRWKMPVVVLLLLGALGGGFWWLRMAPLSVRVLKPQRGELHEEVMGTGTLEARVQVRVGPVIGGLITKVCVDQGARVQAGEPLVHIDDAAQQQQLAIARASIAAAEAAIERLQAEAARAEAVRSQAVQHQLRTAALVAKAAATTEDAERAAEQLSVAEAACAAAKAAINEGRMNLAAAERTLDLQKARLADCDVVAPCAGLVVRRDREPGDVVVPGATVLLLAATEELWISAWVDETRLAELAPGQSVRVNFRAAPDKDVVGVLTRVAREADRETREIAVDITVKQLPERWALGQRADVHILSNTLASALLLPENAVLVRGGRAGVWANVAGHAQWCALKLGRHGREGVEIVEGLEADALVLDPADPAVANINEGRALKTP